MLQIFDAKEEDGEAWLGLWHRYNVFYNTEVPSKVSELTWQRILDPAFPLIGRLAHLDGEVVGFSHAVLHASTWKSELSCYLEDLFVAREVRRAGVGRSLIEDLTELGGQRGWGRLYWHTHRDNQTARVLYDEFIVADEFVRYRLNIEPEGD